MSCNISDDRITLAELAQALLAMGHGGTVSSTRVFEWVRKHREPEWRHGDVVQDAEGNVFRRRIDGYWSRTGRSEAYLHSAPKRPLKRMTVEE